MVTTYHFSAQGRWWEKPSNWLQGFEQSHTEIHVAHAKSWRYLFKAKWCQVLVNTRSLHWVSSHSPKWRLYSQNSFQSPFGKYEYLKVPFGLAQAPAYFQELMNKVFKGLPFTTAYLDDIIIYSKTAQEHLDHLQQVFKKLHNAKISIKLNKCHFFAKEIQHLGHILSTTGIKPLLS